jgi:probable rRNA maturation factor
MISIDVISDNNLWKKKIPKKKFFFNNLVKYFPKKYQFKSKKVELTVLLSQNRELKKLNKKFRKKNKSTDVLSFPSEKRLNLKKNLYLGDIIISYEFMDRPKNLSKTDFKKKVSKIFIHGFLHLLNFDHLTLKDFKKMKKEEEKIYRLLDKRIISFG